MYSVSVCIVCQYVSCVYRVSVCFHGKGREVRPAREKERQSLGEEEKRKCMKNPEQDDKKKNGKREEEMETTVEFYTL